MHGVRGNAVRGLDTQFAFQFGVGTRQLQFAGIVRMRLVEVP